MNKIAPFEEVLNKFENPWMKEYCKEMIEIQPDMNFTMPSSTTKKYHNATQCQDGGQIYHVIMVATIMNHILDLDYMKAKFPNLKQRDCLRIAAILHDACKTNGGKYTVHEHPILAKEWILNTKVEHDIPQPVKEYIGDLVASHSGQWTTSPRSKTVLPSPQTDEQFLVHLADYLGSRSDLDMIYSDKINSAVKENIT